MSPKYRFQFQSLLKLIQINKRIVLELPHSFRHLDDEAIARLNSLMSGPKSKVETATVPPLPTKLSHSDLKPTSRRPDVLSHDGEDRRADRKSPAPASGSAASKEPQLKIVKNDVLLNPDADPLTGLPVSVQIDDDTAVPSTIGDHEPRTPMPKSVESFSNC